MSGTKISVIYDNEAAKGFITGWGFSAIVETQGKTILFDTGWDGIALMKNLQAANIDPKKVDFIIISHDHWDHLGGLSSILYQIDTATVFVPTSFSSSLKSEITKFADLCEVTPKKSKEVLPGVLITRELSMVKNGFKEISLMITTKKGIILLCGCSHPGLDTIIDEASNYGKIHCVMGGFHGFDKLEKLTVVDLVIPCHCTKKKKEIIEKYPNKSKECFSGLVISFE